MSDAFVTPPPIPYAVPMQGWASTLVLPSGAQTLTMDNIVGTSYVWTNFDCCFGGLPATGLITLGTVTFEENLWCESVLTESANNYTWRGMYCLAPGNKIQFINSTTTPCSISISGWRVPIGLSGP